MKLLLILVLLFCTTATLALAQSANVPWDPDRVVMRPWAYLDTQLGPECSVGLYREPRIANIGDVNRDGIGDLAVTFSDCSVFEPWNNLTPTYVRIYLGSPQPDSLPIGPVAELRLTETYSTTWLLASGDFDADGWRDVVTVVRVFEDSSVAARLWVYRVVTWWGCERGYSLADTSQLSVGSKVFASSIRSPQRAHDVDGDGVDDLVLLPYGGLDSAVAYPVTRFNIFAGHRGARWGRNGASNLPTVSWWVPWLIAHEPEILDHDCDGTPDVVMTYSSYDNVNPGHVAVAYGHPGAFPDSADLERIDLTGDSVGHTHPNVCFGDFTGDGVPDMAVDGGQAGDDFAIYAGRPGQRIREQYSNGFAPRTPQRPFNTPWARLDAPHVWSDFFGRSFFFPLRSLGDINRDGYDDLFASNAREIVAYSGGPDMDSLYDAVIPTLSDDYTRLGVIDGSGREAYATIHLREIYIYRQDTAVPHWGFGKRALPHPVGFRCAKASEAPMPEPRLEGGPSLSRSGGEGVFVPAGDVFSMSRSRSAGRRSVAALRGDLRDQLFPPVFTAYRSSYEQSGQAAGALSEPGPTARSKR